MSLSAKRKVDINAAKRGFGALRESCSIPGLPCLPGFLLYSAKGRSVPLKTGESQQQLVLFRVRAGLQDTFQVKGMCPTHGTGDMTGKQKEWGGKFHLGEGGKGG